MLKVNVPQNMARRKSVALLLAAFAAGAAFAASWTYDPAAGTITDGGWTFAATADGTAMTVGACQADPGENSTLDFSKPITNGSTTYTIVTIDTEFSAYANLGNLASLVLPQEGLTKIDEHAFNGCVNLVSITPFLPDSVTEVGGSAFCNVPVAQELKMLGAVNVRCLAFGGTAITSAEFGKGLKSLDGGWGNGCFNNCKSLSRLVFDPEMSGATFGGTVMLGCSSLSGIIDLTGFTTIGNSPFYNSGAKISKIILSSDLGSLGTVINTLSAVKVIEFDGGVPSASDFSFRFDTTSSDGIYFVVPEAYKDEWAAYCEGESINDTDSRWSTNYMTTAVSKNARLIYKPQGEKIEGSGGWVYDDSVVTNTASGWSFSAVDAGWNIVVGPCLTYPEGLSTLDFSSPVTDADGNLMKFTMLDTALYSGKVNGASDAGLAIGELRLPSTGLDTIGVGAFAYCQNITNITPYLPDSVKTVGNNAFRAVPAAQPLSLEGVIGVGISAFQNSGVTVVSFGPSLSTLGNSAFRDATKLSALEFDPEISQAFMDNEVFRGCSKLSGVLDLRGFSVIGTQPFRGYGGSITKVLLSSEIKSLGTLFVSMSTMKVVEFDGGVPPASEFYRRFDDSSLNDVYVVVPSEFAEEWSVYCEGGVINELDSLWSTDYVSGAATRKIYLVKTATDDPGEPGEWIYDPEKGIVTNAVQGWCFQASAAVRSLTVGSCLAYPKTVSTLDFSTPVTDTTGNEMFFGVLDTKMCSADMNSPADCGTAIGRLVLPDIRLTEIGSGAFACCTNITEVTPYLPDCVNFVGANAFKKVPVCKSLCLNGAVQIGNTAFAYTAVTSVTFGASLKHLQAGWESGSFRDCHALTNVIFGEGISGAALDQTTFAGCHNLTGTLDLSGFVKIGNSPFYRASGITIDKVILSSDITSVGSLFNNLGSVKRVEFTGDVPPAYDNFYSCLQNSVLSDVFVVVKKEYRKNWAAYCENGEINHKNSLWSTDYLPLAQSNRMYLIYSPCCCGIAIIVR